MSENLVRLFWKYINDADFDKLIEVMAADARVWLPNTREVFHGSNKYIEFNKQYPGRWFVDIERLHIVGDTVITVAEVFSSNDKGIAYVNSYFKVMDNKIVEINEYWGENGKPPVWRADKGLSERY